MRKITLFIFGIILASTIWLNPVLAQTVTPSPVSSVTPTSVTATITPSPVVLPVPQGISAVMISDDRIDVSWKSSTGASAYEIYRNDELVAIVSSLFYSDNGLDAETSYSYKVRAYDGTNYSLFSTNVSATTRSSSAQGTPEPTIPLGPEDNKLMPSVEETHSYVTVGSVKFAYNEIEAFDSGEEFVILGRSEEYADVEVVVSTLSEPTSYFSKADDDGFWEVSVDTDKLEAGSHSFKIIISTPDFPEKYESEEYSFEINAKVEPTASPEVESSFGSRVNRIILIAIVLVVLLFIILIVVAVKKGWLKKLKSSPDGGEVASQGENMELNNLIQLDHEAEKVPASPFESKDELVNDLTPAPTLSEGVATDVVDQTQSQATEQVLATDAPSTTPDTMLVNPQQDESIQDEVVDENPDPETSPLPDKVATLVNDGDISEDASDQTDITEMTIDTANESKGGLNIEEVSPVTNEPEAILTDSTNTLDTESDEVTTEAVEEKTAGVNSDNASDIYEVKSPSMEEETPFVNEAVPSFSSPQAEVPESSNDESMPQTGVRPDNDYSSTTPLQEGEESETDQTNDEMVTPEGLYPDLPNSSPKIVSEETPMSEDGQATEEKPNDVSSL